jgi:hypothetical protein
MIAIRKIVNRDAFNSFEVPKEFGEKFEVIILPISENTLNNNQNNENRCYKHQEENGFSQNILAQKSEDVWNDI